MKSCQNTTETGFKYGYVCYNIGLIPLFLNLYLLDIQLNPFVTSVTFSYRLFYLLFFV